MRFPTAKPAQRVMLARIAELYAQDLDTAQVAAEVGITAKHLRSIAAPFGLRASKEAKARAQKARGGYDDSPHAVRARAEADAIRAFLASNQSTLVAAARGLGMDYDRVRLIAKRFGIEPGKAHERGAAQQTAREPAAKAPAGKWIAIAWRWRDKRGPWREYDDAPIGLDQVRALCGLAPNSSPRPGHICAHQVAGNKTVLVYQQVKA